MLKYLIFSVFFACAFAQLNFVTLTSGTPATGSIPISANPTYDPQYFAVWVPWNASSVNFTITNPAATTCDLRWNIRSTAWACSEDYYNYECYEYAGYESYVDYGYYDYLILDSYNSEYENNELQWVVNNWVYVTVQRYDDLDNDLACSFTLEATIDECATAGQIGADPDGTAFCAPINNATTQFVWSLNSPADSYAFFFTEIPDFTGSVYMWVNSTTIDLYLYGLGQGTPSYDNYNCYTSSYNTNGSFYIYELDCYTPRSGLFFFYVQNSDSVAATSTVVFIIDYCNTTFTGLGGAYCNMPAMPINFTNPGPYIVPASTNSPDGYGWVYMFWYSYPMNTTFEQVSFCVATANDSGYLYARRNAFPEEYSTWGYEGYWYESFSSSSGACVYLRIEDFFPGGFYWVGINNEGSSGSPLSFTISLNATFAPTSATSVTGQTTQSSATSVTGATGGATGSATGSATGGATGSNSGNPTGSQNSSGDAYSLGVSVLVVLIAAVLSF